MNRIFAYLLLLCPTVVDAQVADSVTIHKVDSLLKNSQTFYYQTDYKNAIASGIAAEKLALEKLGRSSLAYTQICSHLSLCFEDSGELEDAIKWLLVSKELLEQIQGKKSRDYSYCISVLGPIYTKNSEFEKSELIQLESLALIKELEGTEGQGYAVAIANLAVLYRDWGQFEKAEIYQIPATALFKKIFGQNHDYYGTILCNTGNLYHDLGQLVKAEVSYLESKEILQRVAGIESIQYVNTINSLATLYNDLKRFDEAEPLLLESNRIYEKVFGKKHSNYAGSVINLANLYTHRENYEKAEKLLQESYEISILAYGKENSISALSLMGLAHIYFMKKEYDKSEAYYLKSKNVTENLYGQKHSLYAKNLKGLASVYFAQNQFEKVVSILSLIAQSNQDRILSALHHLSEKEMNQFISMYDEDKNDIFTYCQIVKENALVTGICYDNTLFHKGFLLNSSSQIKQLILSTPSVNESYNQFKSCLRKLTKQYTLPISERTDVKELEEKSNHLEKIIAQQVLGFGDAIRQVKWQEVQQNLGLNEAAIEFVDYKFTPNKSTDSKMYGALLLKHGNSEPQYIQLFEQHTLDSILYTNVKRKADYVNSIYTLSDRGLAETETKRKSLFEILWQPLEKNLSGVKTIYFSPSGLLHRINLDAIPISDTQTLADQYHLIQLNSTRQLVLNTKLNSTTNDAVIFGGIIFERDSALEKIEPLIASRSNVESSYSQLDSTHIEGSWNFLKGTEREVDALENILHTSGITVDLKKGHEATEEFLKKIASDNKPSPRILHLATHGFFFPDPKDQSTSSVSDNDSELIFKISEHPMLRSGLILASGNVVWNGQQTLEGKEDGVLTAYEISQMNLSNTELVVLSACETGLGDIQGNEGVYGLQRAFKIAGAKYIIMSLWQVPDKQTSLLMTTFYKKWLEEKMTIPEAFHAAQQQLRDAGLDAYLWAGFVLVE